jgi:hypothetical protein
MKIGSGHHEGGRDVMTDVELSHGRLARNVKG